jgi:restriction endonuclease Mrr
MRTHFLNVDLESVPTFDSMLVPTIQALQSLGGSGTTEEIYEKVVQILNVPDKVLEILHGSTSQSEVEYRLAWSRTYLKKYGLLQNSARGVWSLVSTSINLDDLDPREIVKAVRDADKNKVASSDVSDTRDAIKEATRDGAPPIDLIDGEQLVQRLKELGLGVKIVMIESVEVDTDWFTKI